MPDALLSSAQVSVRSLLASHFYSASSNSLLNSVSHPPTHTLPYPTRSTVKASDTPTIGVDFGVALLTFGRRQVRLQIWDIAGQDRFRTMTRQFFRGSVGGLLVYDITSRESFSHIVSWMASAKAEMRPNPNFALVGAKSDLAARREVSTLEAQAFAQSHGLFFFEVSARTATGVDELFTKLALGLLRREEVEGAEDAEAVAEHKGGEIQLGNDEAVASCRC